MECRLSRRIYVNLVRSLEGLGTVVKIYLIDPEMRNKLSNTTKWMEEHLIWILTKADVKQVKALDRLHLAHSHNIA